MLGMLYRLEEAAWGLASMSSVEDNWPSIDEVVDDEGVELRMRICRGLRQRGSAGGVLHGGVSGAPGEIGRGKYAAHRDGQERTRRCKKAAERALGTRGVRGVQGTAVSVGGRRPLCRTAERFVSFSLAAPTRRAKDAIISHRIIERHPSATRARATRASPPPSPSPRPAVSRIAIAIPFRCDVAARKTTRGGFACGSCQHGCQVAAVARVV